MAEVVLPPKDDVQTQQNLQSLREQYASATKTKIIITPSDIDSKDKIMEAMFAWCKEQSTIVVLKSAMILSSDPTSRTVQNCKSLLLSKGIHPGQVYAANEALLNLILASGEEEGDRQHKSETTASFSDQQRHLRELVFEAVRQNVSDIHIQVRQTYTKIRMRQHG